MPKHPPWKKGESGNPKGRKKDLPEVKTLRHLTAAQMAEIGNMIVCGDFDGLKRIGESIKIGSPDHNRYTALQIMVASCAAKIIQKGDMYMLDVLLNRLIGKVKDQVVHSGIPAAAAPQVIITLPSNGREIPIGES